MYLARRSERTEIIEAENWSITRWPPTRSRHAPQRCRPVADHHPLDTTPVRAIRAAPSLVRRHGRRSPRWTGGSTEPGTSVSTWGLTAREDRSLRPQITPEGTCLPLTALLLRSRGPVRVPSTGEGRRAGHRDGLDAADRAAVSRHTRRRASRRDWCRLPAYGPPVGRMCPERHSPREAGASLGVSCRDRCRFDGHRVSGDHAAKAALLVKASSYPNRGQLAERSLPSAAAKVCSIAKTIASCSSSRVRQRRRSRTLLCSSACQDSIGALSRAEATRPFDPSARRRSGRPGRPGPASCGPSGPPRRPSAAAWTAVGSAVTAS